ncbi:MAG: AP2 domain-containing protein [Gordonibacter sp.]|uniref:AP2 domain-containing protein n=1 Tax=Gordonibacter sp. TaxID=1968902 RepID=UPI002FCB4DE8
MTPYKGTGRWLAQIVLRGKRTRLGIFDTLEDAAEARRQAERELFAPVLEAHGIEPTGESDA